MRRRNLFALLLALFVATATAFPAIAHATQVLAQQEGTENENAGGGEESEGQGQSDADAETGASEEEAEGGAAGEEEGPPWTYQMARISLVLILLFLLGMGLLYYRLIGARQRGTAG